MNALFLLILSHSHLNNFDLLEGHLTSTFKFAIQRGMFGVRLAAAIGKKDPGLNRFERPALTVSMDHGVAIRTDNGEITKRGCGSFRLERRKWLRVVHYGIPAPDLPIRYEEIEGTPWNLTLEVTISVSEFLSDFRGSELCLPATVLDK